MKLKPIKWVTPNNWSNVMNQPPYGQPPPFHQFADPQAPQHYADPAASTAVLQPGQYASGYAAPSQAPAQRRGNPGVILAVFAIIIAAGAFLAPKFGVASSGTATQVTHLQSQVKSLTQRVSTLETQRDSLSQQVTTLVKTQGQLSGQVSGMSTTVRNLAPFSHGVCPGVFQGSKGAFNAPVPCNPGG